LVEEGSVTAHVFTNACDTACDCGYEREITHDFSKNNHDYTHHWIECSICSAVNEQTREEHSGGVATCINKAVCIVCSAEYGNVDLSNHYTAGVDEWQTNDKIHWQECNCGLALNAGAHDVSEWVQVDGTHRRVCEVCDEVLTQGNCRGGEATCESPAICEICDNPYEDALGHEFGEWECGSKGHWRTCTRCGATSDQGEHVFGEWVKDGSYRTRTCECGYSETEATGFLKFWLAIVNFFKRLFGIG
jgi:hypothetical protein